MQAWQTLDTERNGDGTINGMDVDELYLFREDWYVEQVWGAGVVDAVKIWGIGEEITNWEDALPGDPIQFWRSQYSGHNALFVDWLRNDIGEIVGVEYWSNSSLPTCLCCTHHPVPAIVALDPCCLCSYPIQVSRSQRRPSNGQLLSPQKNTVS